MIISQFWRLVNRLRIFKEYFIRKKNINNLKIQIKNIIKNKKKKFIFIYDFSVSPLAYGEVFFCIMFVKSLLCLGVKIDFIFTNNKFRADFKNILSDKKEKNKRIKDLIKLSKGILSQHKCKVKILPFEKIIKRSKKEKTSILFEKQVFNKVPLYKYSHILCSFNYNLINKKDKKKFLLNSKVLKKYKPTAFNFKNYISLGIRINLNNEKNRNITLDELDRIIRVIKKNNKQEKIVIISDVRGYKYLNKIKISKKYKNLIFSKSYTKSFIEDGQIILASKKYYQFKGTGVGMFAEFSNLKFLIFHNESDFTPFAEKVLRSDLYYDFKNKIKNSWSNKYQKFEDLRNFETYL